LALGEPLRVLVADLFAHAIFLLVQRVLFRR